MLSYFVGPIDGSAASVLIAFFGGLTVLGCGIILNYRTRTEEMHKFDLAVMNAEINKQIELKRVDQAHERDMAKLASNRDVEIRRIETGMIDLQAVKATGNAGGSGGQYDNA